MYKRIFVTGDTHGEFSRITKFLRTLEEPSIIIIAGDCGIIWEWDESSELLVYPQQRKRLEKESKGIDILSNSIGKHLLLFVDGNHENFDRLYNLETTTLFGAKVSKVRDNIYWVNRGEILNINGLNIFCFGGAYSHDIEYGILDPLDKETRKRLNREGKYLYRINRVSWWKQEKPTSKELDYGRKQLEENKIDYIITHMTSIENERKLGIYYNNEWGYEFHDFLNSFKLYDYKHWYFGHYHRDVQFNDCTVIYNKIQELGGR